MRILWNEKKIAKWLRHVSKFKNCKNRKIDFSSVSAHWAPGFFLVNDMQIPPPPSKRAILIFLSKKLRNVLKRMKNQFSHFWDFQFLRFGHSFMLIDPFFLFSSQKMRNVLKRIFEFPSFFLSRFLGLEVWSILCSTFVQLIGPGRMFYDCSFCNHRTV